MGFKKALARGKSKPIGHLRRAQLITTYGPGAIVDLPDMSVIIAAVDNWDNNCRIIHDKKLEVLLRKREFREPVSPQAGEDEATVAVIRFPEWHYCPHCQTLGPYWVVAGADKKTCSECGTAIIPSRFVAACENGHLEDFPYRWWVHRGKPCSYKGPLSIRFSARNRGIEGIRIECPGCKANRTMAGCTSPGALAGHACRGKRPWINPRDKGVDGAGCECEMRAIQRTAANAYYPATVSALTMPAMTSSLVDSYWDQLAGVADMDIDENTKRSFIASVLAREHLNDSDLDEVMYAIDLRKTGGGETQFSRQSIYQGEYHALKGEEHDGPNLKTVHAGIPNGYEGIIEGVTLVHRLREVLVIRGFRRILPESDEDDERMASLSEKELDWLPGVELLGEGIFIRFDQGAVDKWLETASSRYADMEKRLALTSVRCEASLPQYVLLHTFAHALIRQLAMECGYSTASLKERIYSTYPHDRYKMCGVLIYTSSADSDGSLGGLVRCGRPESLAKTLDGALRSIGWCSSDPLCIESRAQGYKALNYAACHACALLPETSCEMRNCLLDRVSLIGMPSRPDLGLFSGDYGMRITAGELSSLDGWEGIAEQLVDGEARDFMRRLSQLGADLPDIVGYELDGGEVAEMVWERRKACYLTDLQAADAEAFLSHGWMVLRSSASDQLIIETARG